MKLQKIFGKNEFFSSELLSSDFWYSDRQTDGQTDGKRRIRAHRALAQVGSKIQLVWYRFHQS